MSAAPQIGPDGITFYDGTIQSTAAPDLVSISTAIVLANTQMKTYVDAMDTISNAVVQTSNFTIKEVAGNLVIFYGATRIVSIDPTGNVTSATNFIGYGTP
jgi:hypothetical protein